ncbi:unnamed protein product [Cuscuta campestris]|uniref:Brf1 TBP-binding domain-containing protein n=1 Tax=Cuscuta campestris TaxID=132261 RepID=A0A484M7U9_9ASTE|nr:unnamed protein product [Cuscuta campestris]
MKPTGVRKRKVEIIIGGGGRVDDVGETQSLSDREIAGYLNTKEEIRLKRIIWERLNHQYAHQMAQAKKLKKERDDAKKAKSRGTSNNSSVGSQMRSTMVNYDALKQLDDELNDDNLGSGADMLGNSGSLPRKSRDSDAKNLGVHHHGECDDVDEEEQSFDRDGEQQHDDDDDDTWRYNNTGNNYESSYDYDDDTLGDTNNYDEYEDEYNE